MSNVYVSLFFNPRNQLNVQRRANHDIFLSSNLNSRALCKESSDLVQSDLSNPPVLTAEQSMNLYDDKNKNKIFNLQQRCKYS